MWDLQPEAMEYRDVAGTLTKYVERMKPTSSVHMELQVHGRTRELPPSVGMDLVRIGQEAITNALRHANAQIIHLDLSFEARRVVLRVQDDGKGFDVNHQPDRVGFGLIGMSQRAERLGGKLTIVSQPESDDCREVPGSEDLLRRRAAQMLNAPRGKAGRIHRIRAR